MQATPPVPGLALARIVSAGGPYRPGDEISLAFISPTVSRLVAHDADLRARCDTLAPALIPEMMTALVTYGTKPYVSGELLTLSFVDPHISRVYLGENAQVEADPQVSRVNFGEYAHVEPDATPAPLTEAAAQRPASTDNLGGSAMRVRTESEQIHMGDAMTLRTGAVTRPQSEDAARTGASAADDGAKDSSEREAFIRVRLDWTSERLRRFMQVIDKLFTIDRLGWYRHWFAMRLLVPDEIACADMLASVEAMRHLQALRAAAVESLGKPLLAAYIPGFTITSDWLSLLESPREARAIAGLRDALMPYASDEQRIAVPADDAVFTVGAVTRRELLGENVTTVEAFLPVLIPTLSHHAELTRRLIEYRRLLIELFGQTARAGEPVRRTQMAQPNHSLDDRLWQLVGAAGEAFGGFAHA